MKVSNRDWVQLSSYLDGELSPREVKRLEEKFKDEPALQFAMEELLQTKKILQSTPKLRIPRNFTLPPEMVGVKIRPRPARGYRLAAALMSFMLIGILVLDFGRVFMSGSLALGLPKELMLEALPQAAANAVEESVLMVAEGEIEGADRAVAETEADSPTEEEAPAPAVAAEAVEGGEAVGVSEEAAVEEESVGEVEAAAVEEKSVGEAEDAEVKGVDDSGSDAVANQTDEWQEDAAEELAAPSQTSEPELAPTQVPMPIEQLNYSDETHSVTRFPRIDPFRILEAFLALGAISFAIAAWVIRRRNS